MVLNNFVNSIDLYNSAVLRKEENREGHLQRALRYRAVLYPILERYLDPQNSETAAQELQKTIDNSTKEFEGGYVASMPNGIQRLYENKFIKSKVLSSFVDKLFLNTGKFGVAFDSPPSVNDKIWTKILLTHDFLYYGPITILCLERILRRYEDLESNPVHRMLEDISYGETINEIRVNDFRNIFFESNNQIHKWNISFLSNKQLLSIIERIITEANLLNNAAISLNSSSPIADFEHPCGYIRGAAIIPPASETPFLTLRIHPDVPYTLDQLVRLGMLSNKMKDFLVACQKAGTTIAIAGTMGSGKTTILSALAELWPDEGRKATIEDTPELRPRITDLVKLRTIDYERSELNNVDVARLTKACKRHSVRYVVLSEARDASAWEILQLSQAILGCLMTFHYTLRGSRYLVDQALNTLVSLCKQHSLAPRGEDLKHQIASMIQILLLIEQDPTDNIRRVVKIYYVTGYDKMNGGHFKYTELFQYDREFKHKGFQLVNTCSEFEEYLKLKGVNYQF